MKLPQQCKKIPSKASLRVPHLTQARESRGGCKDIFSQVCEKVSLRHLFLMLTLKCFDDSGDTHFNVY